MEIIPDTDGVPIVMDGTWGLACHMAPQSGGDSIDLEPIIVDGVGIVAYDTVNLARTKYFVDVRFTNPDTEDFFSETFELVVERTISPPSPRP